MKRLFLVTVILLVISNSVRASLHHRRRSIFGQRRRSLFFWQEHSGNNEALSGTEANGTDGSTVAPYPQSSLEKDDDTGMIQLQFEGEYLHDEEIAPINTTTATTTTTTATIITPCPITTNRNLVSFFRQPSHRNLLMKGGANPTHEIPPTREWVDEWHRQARVMGSTPPCTAPKSSASASSYSWLQPPQNAALDTEDPPPPEDSIVAIYSTVPVVPGLSIRAVSTVGCKLLSTAWTTRTSPVQALTWEFTLLEDRYEPQGSAPLVWLYRKLTATPSPSPSSSTDTASSSASTSPLPAGSRRTHGLCRVSVHPPSTTTTTTITTPLPPRTPNTTIATTAPWRVSFFSRYHVSCQLPRRLVHLLPLSQSRLESKVSASMAKQLQQEVLGSAQYLQRALQQQPQ